MRKTIRIFLFLFGLLAVCSLVSYEMLGQNQSSKSVDASRVPLTDGEIEFEKHNSNLRENSNFREYELRKENEVLNRSIQYDNHALEVRNQEDNRLIKLSTVIATGVIFLVLLIVSLAMILSSRNISNGPLISEKNEKEYRDVLENHHRQALSELRMASRISRGVAILGVAIVSLGVFLGQSGFVWLAGIGIASGAIIVGVSRLFNSQTDEIRSRMHRIENDIFRLKMIDLNVDEKKREEIIWEIIDSYSASKKVLPNDIAEEVDSAAEEVDSAAEEVDSAAEEVDSAAEEVKVLLVKKSAPTKEPQKKKVPQPK